jgi:response regulator RpfG family c-di-GMP phosphodiesterase
MAKLNLKSSPVKKLHVPGLFWKILVVDDDPEIHAMTRLVMKDWIYHKKGMELLFAHSSDEARTILKTEKGISLILLDVVMENDHSGLDLVKYIREVLNNNLTRIILRTGQPGKAPLRKVITDYEINDYKEKNELTADRLYVAVTAALRSYEDLLIFEKNRDGLEKVLNATSNLFGNFSISGFAEGVLGQISGLVGANGDSLFIQYDSLITNENISDSVILAGSGKYTGYTDNSLSVLNDSDIVDKIRKCLEERNSYFSEDTYIGFFPVSDTIQNILVFYGLHNIDSFKQQLIRLFSANATVAFSNLYLNKEMEETQREVICTLGEVVESRSKETANHIQRVTETSIILGNAIGLSETDIRNLQMAAPMHDVGKIGIPDDILHKPGRLNPDEFEVMKTHTLVGYEILKSSGRDVLKAAALIALEHHERWDGSGYPYQKSGEEISLMGRIISIVDVFDALYNKRIYKNPWPLENIISLFKEEKGCHFDPKLVDLFLENIDDIVLIQERNKD